MPKCSWHRNVVQYGGLIGSDLRGNLGRKVTYLTWDTSSLPFVYPNKYTASYLLLNEVFTIFICERDGRNEPGGNTFQLLHCYWHSHAHGSQMINHSANAISRSGCNVSFSAEYCFLLLEDIRISLCALPGGLKWVELSVLMFRRPVVFQRLLSVKAKMTTSLIDRLTWSAYGKKNCYACSLSTHAYVFMSITCNPTQQEKKDIDCSRGFHHRGLLNISKSQTIDAKVITAQAEPQLHPS